MENVAPIAVYTSGKGSSAAGLTASVVRDPGTVNSLHLRNLSSRKNFIWKVVPWFLLMAVSFVLMNLTK